MEPKVDPYGSATLGYLMEEIVLILGTTGKLLKIFQHSRSAIQLSPQNTEESQKLIEDSLGCIRGHLL